MEIWKDIPGWEGRYKVSDMGRVLSYNSPNKHKDKILIPQPNEKGYLMVHLYRKPINKTVKVHRLVAKLFVPNPNGLPEVNHKDGNKENNRASNLEWSTRQENVTHAKENGLNVYRDKKLAERNDKEKTPIIATNVKTGEEIYFESINDAMRSLGTTHISDCIKGKRKYAAGHTFRKAVK